MAGIKHLAPTRWGASDIQYAQGVRAGNWLFFTGHEATDFGGGLAPSVAGKPGLPLGNPPRHLREANYILDRLFSMVKAEGSDLKHIVRVDQYYPDAIAVNPYQRARKAILGSAVPPSTSVLMEELLTDGAAMNISMMAVLPGGDRAPRDARADDVPVPPHSGFVPSIVSGDYVFVAGQMPNNEAMDAIAAPAYRAPNAIWNGTDIRLQTEFLIKSRLEPGLKAGGSSLANAIKAQVYLTNIDDLPEFLDVWNAHFKGNPCALTVVPTSGLALTQSIIEINIFGVRDGGAISKQIIEHPASEAMRLGPAAVRAGDLLCLSGLHAADADGALPTVRAASGSRYMGAGARSQMQAILVAAHEICRAAGTTLDQVLRAHHFTDDLHDVYPALKVWSEACPGMPLPFGAVRTKPLPIPHCTLVMDSWVWCP